MQFRKLATDSHLAIRQHFGDGGKRRQQAVRTLVEHERRIQPAQLFQHRPLLARLAREEAAEVEAGAHRARGHVGAGRRRGAGQHLHGHAGLPRGRHEAQPRVGHPGHAGIRAVGDRLPRCHALHHRCRLRADHRLVEPLHRLANIEVCEQLPRHPGVFRAHRIGRAQRLERAQRHIAQIPNGRRHDDEFSAHYSTTSVVSTSTRSATASGSSGAPSRATARAARASASFSAKFALATAIMSLMRLSWFTSEAPGS